MEDEGIQNLVRFFIGERIHEGRAHAQDHIETPLKTHSPHVTHLEAQCRMLAPGVLDHCLQVVYAPAIRAISRKGGQISSCSTSNIKDGGGWGSQKPGKHPAAHLRSLFIGLGVNRLVVFRVIV